MLKAERAYRAELAKVSIADILADLNDNDKDGRIDARRCAFLELRERPQAASDPPSSQNERKDHETEAQHRQSRPEAYQAVSALDLCGQGMRA